MLMRQITAASSPGPCGPSLADNEPIAGPPATPRFVAADSQPRAFARSLGAVSSATYAWMTPTVPPPMPVTMRDKNSIQIEPENAKMMYPNTDAKSAIRSAGRRPYLSEKRPQYGAESSVATLNDAAMAATTNADAPNALA